MSLIGFIQPSWGGGGGGNNHGKGRHQGKHKGTPKAQAVSRSSFDGCRAQKRTNAHLDTFVAHDSHITHPSDAIDQASLATGSLDPTSNRLKIAVLGMSELGRQLTLHLCGKPGLADLTVYGKDTADFDILPFVAVAKTPSAACQWADLIIVCTPSYEAAALMLGLDSSHPAALQNRSVVYLCDGSPGDALLASQKITALGATYLDGCLLGSPDSLGQDGVSILTSGDRGTWERWSPVLQHAAPAAGFCGSSPELANTANVVMCTFLATGWMAYQQSVSISRRFRLPDKVMSVVLEASFGKLYRMAQADLAALPAPAPSSSSSGTTLTPKSPQKPEPIAQATLVAQLELAQRTCVEGGEDSSFIDAALKAARGRLQAVLSQQGASGSDRFALADTPAPLAHALKDAPSKGSARTNSSTSHEEMEQCYQQIELGFGEPVDLTSALA